jgi:tetratricopeptide (TPR) repeat protein
MGANGSLPNKVGRRKWLIAGLAVAAVLIAVAAFKFWPRPGERRPGSESVSAPLPPLTASPFLNTRPGVAYVGDERCAGCHTQECDGYHQHPMGRSLFRSADALLSEPAIPDSNNPFQEGRFHYQVIRRGSKMFHREWCEDPNGRVVAEIEEQMDYAVGSGTQARSYLFDRDGFLFESPITWFPKGGAWGLSPGYKVKQWHFRRGIGAGCAYCHSQEARPVEDSFNRYRDPPFGQLAIGCERCHGPAELHVARRTEDPTWKGADDTIVNPRRLTPALRDAVCEQCHLQGTGVIVRRGRAQTDYRPGLPLHEYVAVFLPPAEIDTSKDLVGHVEQMHQSACFMKSGGRFSCTSCHDPHKAPAENEKAAFYTRRCQACHGAAGPPPRDADWVQAPDCTVPPAERTAKDPRATCVSCHMPAQPSSAAGHIAVTDHRVARDPHRPQKARTDIRQADTVIPLRVFHQELLDPNDAEFPRDLALAALPFAANAKSAGDRKLSQAVSLRALALLDRATARAPDDVPALEGRGSALFQLGRYDEALVALDASLAKSPERETSLLLATDAAVATGRLELAEQYCRRLTAAYPRLPLYRARLANILVNRRAWPEALTAAQDAVREDPFSAEARALLVIALAQTGDPNRAQAEFDVLGEIDPAFQALNRARLLKFLNK